MEAEQFNQPQTLNDPPAARERHAACFVADRYLVCHGGVDAHGTLHDTAAVYDIATALCVCGHPGTNTLPLHAFSRHFPCLATPASPPLPPATALSIADGLMPSILTFAPRPHPPSPPHVTAGG